MEFGQFCCGKLRNFANWPTESDKKFSVENCGPYLLGCNIGLLCISIHVSLRISEKQQGIKNETWCKNS